jgi:hypothetical protein
MKAAAMILSLALACVAAPAQDDAYDFKINKQFMDALFQQNSVQFRVTGTTIDHSGVHALASDCEIHIAASPHGTDFGSPNDFVVEPPNDCQIPPAGTAGHLSAKKLASLWVGRIEQTMFNGRDQNGELVGRNCTFTGFPRIFTEHAQTSGENASNPDHVFEIHPLISADCGGGHTISWSQAIVALPGMRRITPKSADACLRDRTLEVRRDSNSNYLFKEAGATGTSGQCGNFAIVEIVTVDFLRAVNGGHSAIARVSADGQSNVTAKIYTIAGTDIDTWVTQNSGHVSSNGRMYVHGLFTYDYFQVKKLADSNADLSNWTKIDFPLALVLYGETDAPPWQTDEE